MADCIGHLRTIPKLFWLIMLFVVSAQVLLIVSLASPHWSVLRSTSESSEVPVSEVTVGIWKVCVEFKSGQENCTGTGSYDAFTKMKVGITMAVVIGFWPVVLSVLFVVLPGLGEGIMITHLAMACFFVALPNLVGFGYFMGQLNLDTTSIPLMDNPIVEVSWALILNAVGCGLYLISTAVLGVYFYCSVVRSESSERSRLT